MQASLTQVLEKLYERPRNVAGEVFAPVQRTSPAIMTIMPAFKTRVARMIEPAASAVVAFREMKSFFWPRGPSVSN